MPGSLTGGGLFGFGTGAGGASTSRLTALVDGDLNGGEAQEDAEATVALMEELW